MESYDALLEVLGVDERKQGKTPREREAFRMADMLAEILDKQLILAGRQQGRADIAAEKDSGLRVIEMKIARGMQVMGRNCFQAQSVQRQRHALVRKLDEGIGVAAEMRDEARP